MLPEEIWLPVPSKPGLEASSHGRIRILGRMAPTFGVITKASRTAKHRYFGRHIKKVGNIKVHQAVCEAFHGPRPFPEAVVLHDNENGLDNRPPNLGWGTQKQNLQAKGFLAYCRSRTGDNSSYRKGKGLVLLT